MKLAISNLAWDFDQNQEVFGHLKQLNISNIEGVLSKIGGWDQLNYESLESYHNLLQTQGLKVESIQSIFFNYKSEGLHDTESIVTHIKQLVEYCKILNVKVMVLGSPNLRVYTDDLQTKLSQTFLEIDSVLSGTGIELSIEPNTKIYGGQYFHNLNQIVDFIVTNKLKNIKTMVDTHNLILEGYDPNHEIKKFEKFINHVHVSEQNLVPLKDYKFHESFSKTLKEIDYNKIVTLEVKASENQFDVFQQFYRLYS